MTELPACVGVAVGHPELTVAVGSPEEPARSMSVMRMDRLPGPAITIEPQPDGPLPVGFYDPRSLFRGGTQWLSNGLRLLRETWLLREGLERAPLCLSVPAGTSRSVREKCREILRRLGWSGSRVIGHDVTIASESFRDSAQPVCALVLQTDFEGVDLSLIAALQGVVRVRDQIRLTRLSDALLDETVLAACRKALPIEEEGDVDWTARWKDAARIREQLQHSQAAAIPLERAAWGIEATVELARPDVYQHFREDLDGILIAAEQLANQNRVGLGELTHVLVVGNGLLSWQEAQSDIARRLGITPTYRPVSLLATGAVRCTAKPDEELDQVPAATPHEWAGELIQRSSEARHRPVAFGVRMEVSPPDQPPGSDGPQRSVVSEQELSRMIETLWTSLREHATVFPEQSRNLLAQIIESARQLEEEIPEHVPAEEDHPDLALAHLALKNGNLAEAVHSAHAAHENVPNDPGVFRRMIEIHIRAAELATDDQSALNWLECAHLHDTTNRVVYPLLANAYRQKAASLASNEHWTEAQTAIERSLVFEPFNADSAELKKRIQNRGL